MNPDEMIENLTNFTMTPEQVEEIIDRVIAGRDKNDQRNYAFLAISTVELMRARGLISTEQAGLMLEAWSSHLGMAELLSAGYEVAVINDDDGFIVGVDKSEETGPEEIVGLIHCSTISQGLLTACLRLGALGKFMPIANYIPVFFSMLMSGGLTEEDQEKALELIPFGKMEAELILASRGLS